MSSQWADDQGSNQRVVGQTRPTLITKSFDPFIDHVIILKKILNTNHECLEIELLFFSETHQSPSGSVWWLCEEWKRWQLHLHNQGILDWGWEEINPNIHLLVSLGLSKELCTATFREKVWLWGSEISPMESQPFLSGGWWDEEWVRWFAVNEVRAFREMS